MRQIMPSKEQGGAAVERVRKHESIYKCPRCNSRNNIGVLFKIYKQNLDRGVYSGHVSKTVRLCHICKNRWINFANPPYPAPADRDGG